MKNHFLITMVKFFTLIIAKYDNGLGFIRGGVGYVLPVGGLSKGN